MVLSKLCSVQQSSVYIYFTSLLSYAQSYIHQPVQQNILNKQFQTGKRRNKIVILQNKFKTKRTNEQNNC